MFGGLARFSPLMSYGSKLASQLTADELAEVSQALAGDGSDDFLPLLEILVEAEPSTKVIDLLGSPTARKLFIKVQESWLML